MQKQWPRPSSAVSGFTLIELLVALAVVAIVGAIAVPQAISARRLIRFNGVTREITAQLRLTRQLAMSQRQVFRFRYDDATKQVQIIDNEEAGTLANPLANNTADDVVYKTFRLAGLGVTADEITYGTPSGAPTSLPDGTAMTPLAVNGVEVIFQPDGSVVDANGMPVTRAMFFYDNQMPHDTAIAVTVMGAGGRVKNWRYSKDASQYVK